MIAAAAWAAWKAASLRWRRASVAIAAVTSPLRAAMADASSVPQSCWAVRPGVVASPDRFSFTSLAYSGSRVFSVSMLIGLSFARNAGGEPLSRRRAGEGERILGGVQA